MLRIHFAAVAISVTALALPAFAAIDDDPLVNVSYGAASGGKTREQVKSEFQAAIQNGSFAAMTRNRSLPPDYALQLQRRQSGNTSVAQGLNSGGEITFEPPAAGGRTRAEVMQELQRAREDGSLRRMNTNRSY
jgi:predicted RNase H-like HicB family nuclease